jgi:hypothetical protein
MIVEDLRGNKLRVGYGRLTQMRGNDLDCFTTFAQIRRGVKTGELYIWFVDRSPAIPMDSFLIPTCQRLGCCKFSPETFAKILKAAGVKARKPAKKAKARAKN